MYVPEPPPIEQRVRHRACIVVADARRGHRGRRCGHRPTKSEATEGAIRDGHQLFRVVPAKSCLCFEHQAASGALPNPPAYRFTLSYVYRSYLKVILKCIQEQTPAMMAGTQQHAQLEAETALESVVVNTESAEDRFAVRLLNMVQGLRQLLQQGITREFAIFGSVQVAGATSLPQVLSYGTCCTSTIFTGACRVAGYGASSTKWSWMTMGWSELWSTKQGSNHLLRLRLRSAPLLCS